MQYSKKGLKKEIGSTIRLIALITFGGYQEKVQQPVFEENCAGNSLYQRLIRMVDMGKINEAE